MNKHIQKGRLRIVTLATVATFALLLTACGNGDKSASPTATTSSNHNAQDVTFATNMIPHHGQAIEMSEVAETNASNAQVKDLAKRIQAAQQPEIDKMNGWLSSWGEPTVDSHMSASEHMGHGSGMQGMMSGDDMSKLMAAHGASYDRMFLTMMIQHHEGAIAMANTERAKGQFTDAKAMAESIATSQQAEITEMQNLLKQIP